jgi:hypothetical protein
MRLDSFLLRAAVLVVLCQSTTIPCTIITVTNQTTVLVGNNEDWQDPDSKVWFLSPGEGKPGRVYFGFKIGWSQGGMNDRGLFFDWVSGFPAEPAGDAGKEYWPGNLCEKILEECDTVAEAIRIYERYYEGSFATSRILFADATGASAVIGWDNRQVKVWPKAGAYQVLSAEERTRTATERLQTMSEFTVAGLRSVLAACTQTGQHPTRYSVVYDLKRRVIHLYDLLKDRDLACFDLEEELAKGSHHYDIPRLPEQLRMPPLVDGRAWRPVHVDPVVLARYAGRYEHESGLSGAITVDDGRLYAQLQGPTKYGFAPASDRVFFLPHTDAQFVFIRDAEGAVTGMLFLNSGHGDLILKRKD